jgi:plasmid stabilization system protein ParE
MRVAFTSEALAVYEDMLDFLAERSPAGAERVRASVDETLRRLMLFPHSGRTVPEYDDPTLR